MLQAMNTGHDGSMTTIHANSTHDVIIRLDSMILMSGTELPVRAIREMIASAIQLIIHTARLPDGRHIDAVGGWHSAGDYNKLMYENGDGGCVYALLNALEAVPGVFARYDSRVKGVPDALTEALWGAHYVAKMQIPVNGGLYPGVGQGPKRTWMKCWRWARPIDAWHNCHSSTTNFWKTLPTCASVKRRG
jgi:hypothetical protein